MYVGMYEYNNLLIEYFEYAAFISAHFAILNSPIIIVTTLSKTKEGLVVCFHSIRIDHHYGLLVRYFFSVKQFASLTQQIISELRAPSLT